MSREMIAKYGEAPARHDDVYEAISPTALAGSMQDKVVFVTGAGRGIGKAIALAFAEAGANIALLARTKTQLDEVADIITSTFHRKALVFAVDANDAEAVKSAVEETERTLGTIDVAIPNAGVNVFRPFSFTPFDEWWQGIEVNLRAPMLLAKLVLGSMREKNKGVILFIASRAGTVNFHGASAYSVSKTALIRSAAILQSELDMEGKIGIHTYALHPGGVKTEMALSSLHPDLDVMRPGFREKVTYAVAHFNQTAELSAWTCVYLATGRAARALRGKYISVEEDIESVIRQEAVLKSAGLYDLKMQVLGGGAA